MSIIAFHIGSLCQTCNLGCSRRRVEQEPEIDDKEKSIKLIRTEYLDSDELIDEAQLYKSDIIHLNPNGVYISHTGPNKDLLIKDIRPGQNLLKFWSSNSQTLVFAAIFNRVKEDKRDQTEIILEDIKMMISGHSILNKKDIPIGIIIVLKPSVSKKQNIDSYILS